MNPAEFVLIGIALVGSVWAFASYAKSTAADREARRRQRLGVANALKETQKALAEVCVICQRPVEPADDIFDEKTNTWWHQACWRESVK